VPARYRTLGWDYEPEGKVLNQHRYVQFHANVEFVVALRLRKYAKLFDGV
jgi:hypothetical protein